ncbi:uncharacterized protein LOC126785989 [Argentina anserina]|uniref:uncharacterized protein LOC126785989 n=1 Tax=Argentina anserina TaxID=57926 RepID=UPI0021766AC2|nr:uncharacterized protein LOC126785989 [Potentilla anserina]
MEHNVGAAPAETSPSSHPVQHESSPLRISDDASAGTSSPLRPVMTSAVDSFSSPRPKPDAFVFLSELIGSDNVVQENVYKRNMRDAKRKWASKDRNNALKKMKL